MDKKYFGVSLDITFA